tara:strand:- start:60 stop:350 length:291 start_codon:yes stop_codon:yes gene_type:complete
MSKCDVNKKSGNYFTLLSNSKDYQDLVDLNNCVQESINYKLSLMMQQDNKNTHNNSFSMKELNENTQKIYNTNFIYIIFKLSIFLILGISYFYLSK